ncbi:type VII secretion protein EccC [Rhodococcus sp. SRB_17]|nr:type VII secretion protein EccC [Rhodococcus sp. SRB_17]
MSTVRFPRRPRREAPRAPGGEVTLQAPPEIPRATPGNLLTKLLPVVMVVAMIGMVALMFTSGMARNPMSLLFPVMMMVSMLGMLAGGGRSGGARASEVNEDRKDYLRYLDQLRRDVDGTGQAQRRALEWSNPEPALLWTLVGTSRMWERQAVDADYCHVRVGLGSQRLATRLIPPETGPVEDLEPVASVSLRRFVRSHSVVEDLPTAVSLRGFPSVSVAGHRESARALVRAMVMQLCTFHGPDVLQVAVVCGPDTASEWEWVKWLPHTQHPDASDGAGAARMVYGSYLELEGSLGDQLAMRGRFARNAPAAAGVPHVIVVVDGGLLEGDSGLLTATGLDSVTVVDLCGFCPALSASRGLRLVVSDDQVGAVSSVGVEKFASPDACTTITAQSFGRRMAPYRASTQNAIDSGDDDETARSWSQMLGIGNAARFNPDHAWLPRQGRDRLRVPIGVGADGQPVELDLKESAENGMGPHGLCIGATGSGKSEFLRTLVLGLIATHSPTALNLVLVDFKGGATFLGLEDSPHVAAVITNLAEELAMVDRMKDALAGEMNRRQELLRSAGNFANVSDYEKARVAGAALDPLPALFVVVDEFSELLSQQPEFADLFVAIGRLGRSLHIHLLLASQRLDEGKLRGLDSHLSYRIGLKTFSANESRTVLGVPDAYYLPGTPGAGYLKADSAEIVRFQGAYVSGPYEGARIAPARLATEQSVALAPVLFTAAAVLGDQRGDAVVEPDFVDMGEAGDESRTLMGVLVDRIRGHGPRAHEVWLPPLDASPTLDQLLPRAAAGDSNILRGNLTAPFGIVDRPFDQRRELLVADLNGSTGNLAIVGGPQSGKSTALRTLIMSFALTHTAEQVQFYCLDFGGGTLLGLRDLPHVGSVANRLDGDRVRRTVAEVSGVVQERERLFRDHGIDSMVEFRRLRNSDPTGENVAAGFAHDQFGDVFLVIDGWPSVRSDFEPLEASINTLAAQGLSFGVHVIVTASRWADIRPALKDQLGTRIELRLGDPGDSDAGRQKASMVPESHAGRGITREGLHLLTGLPRMDGIASSVELSAAVSATVARITAMSTGRSAPALRMLPDSYTRTDLLNVVGENWPSATAADGRCLRIPIGLGETDLAPVYMDFAEHPHLLVFGDTACGKTSLLRGIAEGIMASNTPAQAKLIIGDYRHSMLGVVEGNHLGGYSASAVTFGELMVDLSRIIAARLPSGDTTQQQLRERSWWSGPEIYVIIDDYDLVATSTGNPVAALLEHIPHSKDIGLHLVIARRSGGAGRALFEPVIARIRDMGTAGVVMSGNRDEGNLVGAIRGSAMPEGRGTYVSRSQTQLVQLPWMPPL